MSKIKLNKPFTHHSHGQEGHSMLATMNQYSLGLDTVMSCFIDKYFKHLVVRYNKLLLQSGAMSSESPGCGHDCSRRNGNQSKILKVTRKVKMHYKFLTRNKWLCD